MPQDPVLAALTRLENQVSALTAKVSEHETKLRWVASAALLVIGMIGGPNAVSVITGGGGS